MLTKNLSFDSDVLDTIKGAQWSSDGLSMVMPQMDRKLYEKVKKALGIMGGTWSPKAKATLFTQDPRAKVEGFLSEGILQVVKDGWFPTPLEVVRRMTELVHPTGFVLEPSAGEGAIADHLPILQSNVFCVELNPGRAQILRDKGYHVFEGNFLGYEPYQTYYDTIFMNPPFEEGQDIDHVRHAYRLLGPDGKLVSVMCANILFNTDKKHDAFRQWLNKIYSYVEELPEKSFHKSGTDINTVLVMIKKRADDISMLQNKLW